MANRMLKADKTAFSLLYHGNVCSSQPYVSREQRRPYSGSAQARLIFGSGLLRAAQGLLTPITQQGLAKTNLIRNY